MGCTVAQYCIYVHVIRDNAFLTLKKDWKQSWILNQVFPFCHVFDTGEHKYSKKNPSIYVGILGAGSYTPKRLKRRARDFFLRLTTFVLTSPLKALVMPEWTGHYSFFLFDCTLNAYGMDRSTSAFFIVWREGEKIHGFVIFDATRKWNGFGGEVLGPISCVKYSFPPPHHTQQCFSPRARIGLICIRAISSTSIPTP